MKKFFKSIAWLVAIGLFLFLLLPFVFPNIDSHRILGVQVPQIFTSNPLVDVARRLFGTNSQKNSLRYAFKTVNSAAKDQYTPQPYEEETLSAFNRQDISSQQTSANKENPDETNARFFLQGDDGEWVLIQQRAPETSTAGMHEISIKEDAYNQFVKQERNARFSPATRQAKMTEVPDSKLAQLFNPIKQHFLRFKSATPAQSGQLVPFDSSHSFDRNSSVSGNGRSNRSTNRGAQNGSSFSFPPVSLASLINPTQLIKDAADLVASSISDPSAREQARQGQQQSYTENMQLALKERLEILANDEIPEDQLAKTLACRAEKGMIDPNPTMCNVDEYDVDEATKQANLATFQQLTGMDLPQTTLVPVLGIADSSTLNKMDQNFLLGTEQMYGFMLKQAKCQQQNCFWIANDEQTVKVLRPSIESAGVTFAGDPLHKYNQLKADFVAQQLKEYERQKPQATEAEKKQHEQTLNDLTHPAYVLYTQQDMQNLLTKLHTSKAPETPSAESENTQVTPVLYIPDAADAKAFADQYGYDTPFVPGSQQHSVFSLENGSTLASRSDIVTRDLAAHVNLMQELMLKTQQDATQKAVQNTAVPVMQEIQKQLADDLQNFSKANAVGQTIK